MVDQATLSLSIDASEAKRGAAEFCRAADDIKRKATEAERAVERGSRAFRSMRAAANDNSSAQRERGQLTKHSGIPRFIGESDLPPASAPA